MDPTQPYVYSFVVRDGKILESSVTRFTTSRLPDGNTLANEKVDWDSMNHQYRNKVLEVLRHQMDSLPSEEGFAYQAPGLISTHDEYRRAD